MIKKLCAVLALVVLNACAGLGAPPADTFNKKVATGYATVQAVAESATVLYTSGKLGETDRTNVVASTRAAMQGLMVAQALFKSACPPLPKIETPDPSCSSPAANDKLTATFAVLTALQAYLATQGAK